MLQPKTPHFSAEGTNLGVEADRESEEQLVYALSHLDDFRCQVYLVMEHPKFNFVSRSIQVVLIFLIISSILLLFTETVTSYQEFSPDSPLCRKVLEEYCSDKTYTTDPGCFMIEEITKNSETAEIKPLVKNDAGGDAIKMKWGSENEDWWDQEYSDENNFFFGSTKYRNYVSELDYDKAKDDNVLPFEDEELNRCHLMNAFQDEEELTMKYGKPHFLTTRDEFQRTQAICTRLECLDRPPEYKGNNVWIPVEFVVNGLFTLELIMRLYGTVGSGIYFFRKVMNWFDIAALVPFYIEGLVPLISDGTLDNVDFGILASAPLPIAVITARSLKVIRLFKLLRHFTASKVLLDTARLGWKEMAAIISMLIFFTIVFAIICFELERGDDCYKGDDNCGDDTIPEELNAISEDGTRIQIDKNGDAQSVPNVYYGIWFSFVTLTTTGYGDIVPVTNIGRMWTIMLILWGAIYMSMPLTVAASTFSYVHDKYERCHGRISDEELGNKATVEAFQQMVQRSGVVRQLSALDDLCRSFFEQLESQDISFLTGNLDKQNEQDKNMIEMKRLWNTILEETERVVMPAEEILESFVRASLAVRAIEISVGSSDQPGSAMMSDDDDEKK